MFSSKSHHSATCHKTLKTFHSPHPIAQNTNAINNLVNAQNSKYVCTYMPLPVAANATVNATIFETFTAVFAFEKACRSK